jgi:hypothetical protein
VSHESLYCQRLAYSSQRSAVAPGVSKTDRVARFQQMQQQWAKDRCECAVKRCTLARARVRFLSCLLQGVWNVCLAHAELVHVLPVAVAVFAVLTPPLPCAVLLSAACCFLLTVSCALEQAELLQQRSPAGSRATCKQRVWAVLL